MVFEGNCNSELKSVYQFKNISMYIFIHDYIHDSIFKSNWIVKIGYLEVWANLYAHSPVEYLKQDKLCSHHVLVIDKFPNKSRFN